MQRAWKMRVPPATAAAWGTAERGCAEAVNTQAVSLPCGPPGSPSSLPTAAQHPRPGPSTLWGQNGRQGWLLQDLVSSVSSLEPICLCVPSLIWCLEDKRMAWIPALISNRSFLPGWLLTQPYPSHFSLGPTTKSHPVLPAQSPCIWTGHSCGI